jgi:hypothetical protein
MRLLVLEPRIEHCNFVARCRRRCTPPVRVQGID